MPIFGRLIDWLTLMDYERAKSQARSGDAITADKLRLMSRQADMDMEHITTAMRAANLRRLRRLDARGRKAAKP